MRKPMIAAIATFGVIVGAVAAPSVARASGFDLYLGPEPVPHVYRYRVYGYPDDWEHRIMRPERTYDWGWHRRWERDRRDKRRQHWHHNWSDDDE